MTDYTTKVNSSSLLPLQPKATIRQIQSSNFFAQYMLKHRGCSEFYTYIEFLYAGLLESSPDVEAFVPHPFLIRVGKLLYTPSFYINSGGEKLVVHISDSELPIHIKMPLYRYLKDKHFEFKEVVSKDVLDKKIQALNWLELVRRLHTARDLDTSLEERQVLSFMLNNGKCRMDELIDPYNREGSQLTEIAILRLINLHVIKAEMVEKRLHYGSMLWAQH